MLVSGDENYEFSTVKRKNNVNIDNIINDKEMSSHNLEYL